MNLEEALKEIDRLKAVETEKTSRITELEGHLQKQAQNFKKLRDMTEEEKSQFTEKELALKAEMEAHQEEQQKFRQEQEDFRKAQKESNINSLIEKYARGDKEVADKIRNNLTSLKDFDTAETIEVLTSLTTKAVNMLGKEEADPLLTAHNTGGNPSNVGGGEKDFATTEAGKSLAEKMGLVVEEPKKD